MSYDVEIGEESFSHTANTYLLLQNVLCGKDNKSGIYLLHGMKGAEAAEHIEAAFERIERLHTEMGEAEMLKKYDSRNGWGSVITTMIFLSKILAACHRHPFERITIC